MEDAAILELFQRLGLALGIGFLVGVERGWKNRTAPQGARAAGLRTHAIAGLSGGAAGALTPAVGPMGFAALALAFAVPWVLFKLREADRDGDVSVTGTIGGLLVFTLGALAVLGDMRVAAAAGVALTALLAFKSALHAWLRALTWEEMRSALLILAATAIMAPLLPDRPVDPWALLNPRSLWLLTVLVASASFAGYVAVRLLGDRAGLAASSVFGALVSSTLVTVELGRRIRSDGLSVSSAVAGACWAGTTSLLRLLALTAVAAAPALALLWKPVALAALTYAMAGWILWRRKPPEGGRADGAPRWQSPLDLVSVVRFAALLAGAILAGRILSRIWGEAGLLPFAAAAGLADVDTVALAAGSLQRSAGLSPDIAAHAILVAALVNAASKTFLAGMSGGPRYALGFGGASMAALLAALAIGLLEAFNALPI